MTVPTSTAKSGPYAGAGTTGPFTVSFRFLENSHIQVIKTSSAGVDTTLALTADYTVAGAGGTSGTVTLLTALAVGEKLTIVRNVPFTQDADYVQNDAFPAESHERALDKLTMQTQQLLEAVDRALQVPVTSSQTSDELIEELLDVATTATAAAGSASTSASSASASAAAAAASEAAAEGYVGNIINNPILGDDVFNGNGSTTAFTLSRSMTAGTETALLVTISGVTQAPTAAYSVSGTTLTFTGAPPAATGNIRVRYIGAMAVDAALASAAATSATASATTASTVATNAGNSATAASGSASTASTAATNAGNSATSASGSASTASTAATNAGNSATAAAGSASSASSSASSAASSASAAASYLTPVVSTSVTSLSIGTGSKSLTVDTGKQWVPGMPIKIVVTASPSTNFMTGTVTSYNSGTGALVVDVSAVGGSGTYSAWTLSLQSGTSATLTTKLLRFRFLYSGTTYTPASDVAAFYAQVFGATGGASGGNMGGVGGPGYSEKYFPSPSGSYTYSIGAAGSTSGTAGGTTTFGGAITITGSGGATTGTGASGGFAGGGDFNANGGSGGNYSGTSGGYGGCGGAGSRAGVGGNGGAGFSSVPGGQGGTGGNSGSGIGTDGVGATTVSGSALVMPWGGASEVFYGGRPFGLNGIAAIGAPALNNDLGAKYGYQLAQTYSLPLVAPVLAPTGNLFVPYPFARYNNTATDGMPALIVIIEVLK